MIRPEDVQVDQSSPLGRGRTKTVYKATMGNDVVAIKVLSQDASPQPLIQRSSIWETLQHPNVLRIFGVSPEDADPLFIVSELHPNADIKGYLDENPNADRPQLALDVALGMQYLHSRNIIHGGLKTSDILVKEDGHACIADYGVTEIQSSKNSENHRYFSPEAWKGTTSKPSDVFAFAMCALEIFTSTQPFGVLSEKHIYRSIVQENARPDRPDHALCVRVGLTDVIWGVIEESWDKEPRLRPSFDIVVRMWGAGGNNFGGGGGGGGAGANAGRTGGGGVYAPNPVARRDSLHSVSSGPPAYELESKPPSLPSVEEVRPDGPVRSISLNSSTSSPPPSFSAVATSAPDLFSRELREKGQGTPTFQIEAASPSSTSSGVFGGGSSLPGLSRNTTSTSASASTSAATASTSAVSESSASPSPTTSAQYITMPPTQMTTAAVATPGSAVGPSSSQPSPTSSYPPTTTTMYGLGANVYSNLPSPALSESFSRPVQPLKVPNRAGSPPITAAMTGNNGGGGGGGLGPGAMAGMNQGGMSLGMGNNMGMGMGPAGSRASMMSGYSNSGYGSGMSVSDRESISSSGSGARYHPNSLMPRRRRTLIIQNQGQGRGVGEPPSTPASFDSFNQRGAGSPPQRIIEEDETLSNNSNAPYPVASHPYPGTGAGGGSASGSGSGGTSRNGSGINLALGNASNLSADTRARLATLSHAHSISQSQREVPGLGGGGMAGGGGGYAPSIAGMSDVMSFGNRSMSTVMANPVLLAGALQAEVKAGRKDELVDDYLVKVYHLAIQSDKSAQKLITAGLVPTLILLLKTRAASSGEGLDFVLMALGALSYDTISSNTIFRTNTTTTLIELFTSSYSDEISALSIWCLSRICRSAEIAQGLIKAGLVKHLLTKGLRGGQGAARLSAWCVGSLIHTDAIAETLADMVIPDMVEHLRQSTNNPESSSEDICSAMFAIGRMARSIKLSKSLAKAGCIEPLAHHLNMSDDPRVLDWSARAVGCLMRPNSSDMSRLLLDAGIATGLARMPSVLPSDEVAPLASFAFAIQRFSCAEWGGGTRKALVEAGVVDSLLAALRTAADEPYPQVHIELALAVSFLGDVGGKDIRKEIVSAGGVKILKKVGSVGSPEVAKACNMAATSITGNIWTRNAASAKTAMTHNWSGGCPEYHPPCPVLIQEDEEIDRLGDAFSEGVGVID